MSSADPEIVEHYEAGAYEHGRLGFGVGRLELVRTRELLERYLPRPPAIVADVGGAAGVYASWLAGAGYDVHLSDLVPLHVEQARDAAQEHPFSALVADARELYLRDRCVDVVLLLGPLYHLTERGDRMRALREGYRVLRPGGVIACAAVSRYASLLDGVVRGFLEEPAFAEIVERDLRSGQHRNPERRPEWWTTAFFHHPDELAAEVLQAGFELEEVFGVEGPGGLLPADEFERRWSSERGREAITYAARAVEVDPAMRAVSAHLLAIGSRPS